jgi:hypothetical protein
MDGSRMAQRLVFRSSKPLNATVPSHPLLQLLNGRTQYRNRVIVAPYARKNCGATRGFAVRPA